MRVGCELLSRFLVTKQDTDRQSGLERARDFAVFLFVAVLRVRAYHFGIYSSGPDVWKLPHKYRKASCSRRILNMALLLLPWIFSSGKRLNKWGRCFADGTRPGNGRIARWRETCI